MEWLKWLKWLYVFAMFIIGYSDFVTYYRLFPNQKYKYFYIFLGSIFYFIFGLVTCEIWYIGIGFMIAKKIDIENRIYFLETSL